MTSNKAIHIYHNSTEEHLLPSKRHKNNVGIVSNTNKNRNKRVQTNVAMVGETRNELLYNLNGKLEIIQKDIGYSSDADMSDAVEVKTIIIGIILMLSCKKKIYNQFCLILLIRLIYSKELSITGIYFHT